MSVLKVFLNWLNEESRGGVCKGDDLAKFYKVNPNLSLGKIRKFCDLHSQYLRHVSVKGVATITCLIDESEIDSVLISDEQYPHDEIVVPRSQKNKKASSVPTNSVDSQLSAFIRWIHSSPCGQRVGAEIGDFNKLYPEFKITGKLRVFCAKHDDSLTYTASEGTATITLTGICVVPAAPSIWTEVANINNNMLSDARVELETLGFNHDFTKHPQMALINEMKQSLSVESKATLYANEVEIKRLLESNKGLVEMAEEVGNITTTHLATVLVGQRLLSIFKSFNGRNSIENTPSDPQQRRRVAIAYDAIRIAKNDRLTGHEISTWQYDTMKASGVKGESALVEGLTQMGVARDQFWTEEEQIGNQKASAVDDADAPESPVSVKATPDILFKAATMINGKLVSWIEAKNSVAIPGITPEQKMNDMRNQVLKYTVLFGPGAILFTKCGFAESTQLMFGDTLCLRPNTANSRHKLKKVKKVKKISKAEAERAYWSGEDEIRVDRNNRQIFPRGYCAPVVPKVTSGDDVRLRLRLAVEAFERLNSMPLAYASSFNSVSMSSCAADDNRLPVTWEGILATGMYNDPLPQQTTTIVSPVPPPLRQCVTTSTVSKMFQIVYPDKSTELFKKPLDTTLSSLYLEVIDALKNKGLYSPGQKVHLRANRAPMVDLLDYDKSLSELNLFSTVINVFVQ